MSSSGQSAQQVRYASQSELYKLYFAEYKQTNTAALYTDRDSQAFWNARHQHKLCQKYDTDCLDLNDQNLKRSAAASLPDGSE